MIVCITLVLYHHLVAETLEELQDSESLSKTGSYKTWDEVNWFTLTSTMSKMSDL